MSQFSGKSYSSTDPRVKYAAEHSLRLHPTQQKLMEKTMEHTRAKMMGSPDQLQFLTNLLKMTKAKKTLDVGVFTGYSALAVALVLPPDGKVIACDVNEDFVNVGKPFWKEAGVENKIDLRIAPASQTLQSLIDGGETGTFDYIFIDADKTGYDDYYEKGLVLLRPGGFIAIDNTLWSGKVCDDKEQDTETNILRALNEKIHKDKRVDVSLLTVGDGTTLVFKPY